MVVHLIHHRNDSRKSPYRDGPTCVLVPMPRFERPLAERREAGTDLVKPLDTLAGAGGFVMSTGGQRQSRGQLWGVIRISVLHDFLVWQSLPTGHEVDQPDHGCPAAPVEPCVPDLAHSGCTRFSVVRSGPRAELRDSPRVPSYRPSASMNAPSM